jgi:beta-glucosidase
MRTMRGLDHTAIRLCLTMALCASSALAQVRYPFQDKSLPVEKRVDDLVSRMTLEEKILCLATRPAVPRLGITASGQEEGLHGLALGGPARWSSHDKPPVPTTIFPQSRGLGNTWDAPLLREVAAVEAYEARYYFQRKEDPRGALVLRAPNVDLSRDPRWGRSEESYGEDPFLVGTLAVSFIHGLQGDDPNRWMASSLMKHFLANSNEDGRGSSSSNFDERLFYEYYSVPFRMGIEQGGAQAMMTSYNAWNGIPMTVNPVLRATVIKRWGFDGILCTDGGALTNLVADFHRYPDLAQAAAAAIHAGINQFLDDSYYDAVHGALSRHLVTEAEIESSIKGSFRVMARLGLLDVPEDSAYAAIGRTVDKQKGPPADWAEHKALARRVTDESIVLLKNEGEMLPFDRKTIHSIAVIGPYADKVLLDWYSGTPPYTVSPVEGIRAAAGKEIKVEFYDGSDLGKAAKIAREADRVVVVVGNHPTCDARWALCPNPTDGKEGIDRKSVLLDQEQLVAKVFAANPKTVVALISSFPYIMGWTQAHLPAIVHMTHGSQEEGNGLADVLFGVYNPAGRLTQTWPATEAQLPPMMDYDLRHGRTYLYTKAQPQYAFGFGLSYTTFSYRHARMSAVQAKAGSTVRISVDVTNTGKRDGDEVLELYVKHPQSKVERPQQELKGFTRVHLKAGETQAVSLPLRIDDLAYWDVAAQKFTVEPETIDVVVGSSSDAPKFGGKIQIVP